MLKMLTTYMPAWLSYNIVNGGRGGDSDFDIKFSFLHLFKYILSKVVAYSEHEGTEMLAVFTYANELSREPGLNSPE